MIIDYGKIDNKNFLITGVAGFIGFNIASRILSFGGRVIGIDNLSNDKSGNIKKLNKLVGFKFFNIDLSNYEKVEDISKNVDYIIHEADLILVNESIEEPKKYINNNVNSMMNILEAARQNKVKKVIYASSAAVYGSKEANKENVKTDVNSIYGLTKKIEEDMANVYYKLYGVNTIGLRYFNVYGKYQTFNNNNSTVIPSFVRGALKEKKICIYGDENIQRDFIYIEDIINANLLACVTDNKLTFGKIFNIGTGKATTLKELAEIISKILCTDNISIEIKNGRKGDIKKSVANIENSKKQLEYIPQYTLEEGLKLCIDWYIKNI